MSAFPSRDYKPLFIRCFFPTIGDDHREQCSSHLRAWRRISFCCGKAGKPPGIRKTLFTFSRGDELDYRIISFLLIQQNCQMLWKMVEMRRVFSFRNWKSTFWLLHPKKKKKEVLVFNILHESSEHFFFLWKSIFVRKDFLIFCSQCHSRTRSAVYADTSNPWHPKSKHDHPSHWRYVGMYTEYRHYVCPSIAGGAGEYTRRTCKAWAGIKLLTTALPVSHAIFHHHFQVIVKSDAIYVPNSFMFLQLFCSTAAKPNWGRHIAPFSNNLGCKKCLSQQERMGLGFRSVSLGSHIGPGF